MSSPLATEEITFQDSKQSFELSSPEKKQTAPNIEEEGGLNIFKENKVEKSPPIKPMAKKDIPAATKQGKSRSRK